MTITTNKKYDMEWLELHQHMEAQYLEELYKELMTVETPVERKLELRELIHELESKGRP